MADAGTISDMAVTGERRLFSAYGEDNSFGYLEDVWNRRHYIGFVASAELRSRQMTTGLGNLWHLLNPLLQIGVYFLIFGLVLKVDRGVDNFIAFLTVGIFVYGFTQRCTTIGASAIVGNRGILTQFRFPRAVLPITAVATETIAMIPPLLVMYAVALASGASVRSTWMLLPILVMFQASMNVGLAMIAARATHHLRDVTQILPFIFRLLFYGSGVIFNVEAYTNSPLYRWFFYANPLFDYIAVARWAVLGDAVAAGPVVAGVVWTIVLPAIGFMWFRGAESQYGRD